MRRTIFYPVLFACGAIFSVEAMAALQIPQKFWGRWEASLRDCTKPDDHEDIFHIQKDGFQYYETFEKLTSLIVHSPADVSVVLKGVYGEDIWTTKHRMKLSPDGKRISMSGKPGYSFRCP